MTSPITPEWIQSIDALQQGKAVLAEMQKAITKVDVAMRRVEGQYASLMRSSVEDEATQIEAKLGAQLEISRLAEKMANLEAGVNQVSTVIADAQALLVILLADYPPPPEDPPPDLSQP